MINADLCFKIERKRYFSIVIKFYLYFIRNPNMVWYRPSFSSISLSCRSVHIRTRAFPIHQFKFICAMLTMFGSLNVCDCSSLERVISLHSVRQLKRHLSDIRRNKNAWTMLKEFGTFRSKTNQIFIQLLFWKVRCYVVSFSHLRYAALND